MDFWLALAPSALIIALSVILWTSLPKDRVLPRYLLLVFGVLIVARYLPWRWTETVATVNPLTPSGAWIWFLFGVEIVFLFDFFKSLVVQCRVPDRAREADAAQARLESTPESTWPKVDVFIPTYNEPIDVLERTIVGAQAMDYPNFVVHVLDDGGRTWLREYCEAKGARYIAREDSTHAKAGNMNHALSVTDGDLINIFDADFVPYRWFLRRTVGLFEDRKIGIVQTPQHFFNRDPVQRNLWMADRWPDEQRLFFDKQAPAYDSWDSMFCCGSCSVLRREALDEIGGVPTSSITEDILTTLEMLRKGYKTRYLNERISIGLAAETLDAFFVQRQRWCQGGIQTLFLSSGPLGPGLNLMRRILLFPIYWVFHLPARLLLLLIPILYLWFDLEPLHNAEDLELLYWQIPVLVIGWTAAFYYNGRQALPILNDGVATLIALRLFPTIISSIIRPFGRPFKVTPKGSLVRLGRSSVPHVAILLALATLTIGGILFNIPADIRIVSNEEFLTVASLWALMNLSAISIAIFLSFESAVQRYQERFPVQHPCEISLAGKTFNAETADISLTGCRVTAAALSATKLGEPATLTLSEIGTFDAKFVRHNRQHLEFAFVRDGMTPATRDALIRYLYTTGIANDAQPGSFYLILQGLWRRFFGNSP